MRNLSTLDADNPEQLIEPGLLDGRAIGLDVDSIRLHATGFCTSLYEAALRRDQSKNNAAVDGGSSASVALKVVFAPDVRPPHDVRREARILSRLSRTAACNSVVKLLNAYLIDGHYVLALRPFYDRTLDHLLSSPRFVPHGKAGPVSVSNDDAAFHRAVRILAVQMCSAVAFLHSQGTAHRDISPSNWILGPLGQVVLVDFGVSWDRHAPGRESAGRLEFELGTGSFRAPELLFGSRTYSPEATDIWALGANLAMFFTPIADVSQSADDEEDDHEEASGFFGTPVPAWMLTSMHGRRNTTTPEWRRSALFDGGHSDFALVGSIFRTLGTPTRDIWPEAGELPDFGKFTYRHFEPADMAAKMPYLPATATASAGDLADPLSVIRRMLVYQSTERLPAREAVQSRWLEKRNTEGAGELVDLSDFL